MSVATGILDQLALRHGTDKASGSHNYMVFYERFLAPMRDMPIRLLEIGVGGGHSLRVWRDYFQRAKITGMDIDEDRRQYASDEGRITIEIGDQSDGGRLREIQEHHGPFDVIVDDAGHDPNAQIFSHRELAPLLTPNGLYILEDIGSDQAMDYLLQLGREIVLGRDPAHGLFESIAFYRETSVTRRRGE